MKRMWARLTVAVVFAFALDWFTKQWAEQTLFLHQPIPLIGQLVQLTLGYNTGVAFGLLTTGGLWLALLSGLLLFGIGLWLVRVASADNTHPALIWLAGLLLGGGAANLLDRLLDGRVTDFIDVGFGALRWPTFNFADVCIVIAVIAFLVVNAQDRHTTKV